MASVVLFPNQLPARTCPRAFSLSPTLSLPTYASLSKTASRRVQDGPDFERVNVYGYGVAPPKHRRHECMWFLTQLNHAVICQIVTRDSSWDVRDKLLLLYPLFEAGNPQCRLPTVMWRLWAWWQVELYQGLYQDDMCWGDKNRNGHIHVAGENYSKTAM